MLQNKVNLYPSNGIPGQQVAFGQAVYTPENYVSDGTVKCGCFAFAKANTANATAVTFPLASVKASAGAVAIGLVERTFSATVGLDGIDTDVYPQGAELTIAIRGDYYIEAPATATVGQSVLCDPATGAVTFGTAGSANDTGWVVKTAGAKGDLIVISNHGVNAIPAKSA